jgi:flagellar biosynthesis protein FliQ
VVLAALEKVEALVEAVLTLAVELLVARLQAVKEMPEVMVHHIPAALEVEVVLAQWVAHILERLAVMAAQEQQIASMELL